MKEFLAE